MQDELVKIVNINSTTGYTTTRRSWMKPGDIIYDETISVIPETIPVQAEIKITQVPINKRKSKK